MGDEVPREELVPPGILSEELKTNRELRLTIDHFKDYWESRAFFESLTQEEVHLRYQRWDAECRAKKHINKDYECEWCREPKRRCKCFSECAYDDRRARAEARTRKERISPQ